MRADIKTTNQLNIMHKTLSLLAVLSAPAPSLKGNSGMVELGTTVAPFDSKNILLNLNIQGWTGVQRGISGGAGCTIKF